MLLVTLEAEEEPFLSHSGPLESCRCIAENWMIVEDTEYADFEYGVPRNSQ